LFLGDSRSAVSQHPRCKFLYITVTDGYGTVRIGARLVDADEERDAIWEDEHEVEFEDPRTVADIAFLIADATFPQPGEYRFQLFAAGEFLMERRIVVAQIE
jgi:hypothetical protein